MSSHEYRPRLPDQKADSSTAWELQNQSLNIAIKDITDRLLDSDSKHFAKVTCKNNCFEATYGDIVNAETNVQFSLAILDLGDGENSIDFTASEVVLTGEEEYYYMTRKYIILRDKAGKIIPFHSRYDLSCDLPARSDLEPAETPPKTESGEDSKAIFNWYLGAVDDFQNFTIMRSEQMLSDIDTFKVAAGLS